MSVDFKTEYVRAASTGVWHVIRFYGSPRTLCGRKIESDKARSWPGFNTKWCKECVAKKKERA